MRKPSLISVEPNLKAGLDASSRGDITIVVDVLRFSSSVVVGLAHGVTAITPVRTLKEARLLRKQNKGLILAGEREGLKLKGFQLGNSPSEFLRSDLDGKQIVMTTTNGTMALEYSKGSRWLLVGSFINARAVSEAASAISKKRKGISIILACRLGRFFLEDFLCAGLLVSNMTDRLTDMNDEAMAARLAWLGVKSDFRKVVRKSKHAVYLREIGYEKDVELCLQRDTYDLVPHLKKNKIIRL
jgi:2-phosphosulfolactate phosphatase